MNPFRGRAAQAARPALRGERRCLAPAIRRCCSSGDHYFEIHDPKTRTVAAADFRDRVVHHAIVRVLEPLFGTRLIEDTYACRRGKGTHAALRRAAAFARRHSYALECDVPRYFPSIDQAVLLAQVERVVADARLLALLRHILASHADAETTEWLGDGLFDIRVRRRGIPIGNLTSQFLANVYLSPPDHFVKHGLRVRGYLRYRRARYLVERGHGDPAALTNSVQAWVAHARHAKSQELRHAVLYSH